MGCELAARLLVTKTTGRQLGLEGGVLLESSDAWTGAGRLRMRPAARIRRALRRYDGPPFHLYLSVWASHGSAGSGRYLSSRIGTGRPSARG
jgi:hypothetical protein